MTSRNQGQRQREAEEREPGNKVGLEAVKDSRFGLQYVLQREVQPPRLGLWSFLQEANFHQPIC